MFLATQRIQTRSSISDVDNNQRDLTAVIANILPIEDLLGTTRDREPWKTTLVLIYKLDVILV